MIGGVQILYAPDVHSGNIQQAVIDFEYPAGHVRTVVIDDEIWNLEGECNRCGACCDGPDYWRDAVTNRCQKLRQETDEHGMVTHHCSVYWSRPFTCLLYPFNPHDPLPDECSFHWVRVHG